MKFRIKPYDLVNDIWLLQRRVFWMFWRTEGVGTEKQLTETIKKL